jgi:hypothetical protein
MTDPSKIRRGGFSSRKPDVEDDRKGSGVDVAKVAGLVEGRLA